MKKLLIKNKNKILKSLKIKEKILKKFKMKKM